VCVVIGILVGLKIQNPQARIRKKGAPTLTQRNLTNAHSSLAQAQINLQKEGGCEAV